MALMALAAEVALIHAPVAGMFGIPVHILAASAAYSNPCSEFSISGILCIPRHGEISTCTGSDSHLRLVR